jgi:hypothetical protein
VTSPDHQACAVFSGLAHRLRRGSRGSSEKKPSASRLIGVDHAFNRATEECLRSGTWHRQDADASGRDACAAGCPAPRRRHARDSGIVDAILYLESARFVTSEILHIDGGQNAGHPDRLRARVERPCSGSRSCNPVATGISSIEKSRKSFTRPRPTPRWPGRRRVPQLWRPSGC